MVVIDEFHVHPNADAGFGDHLRYMARTGVILVSGTRYESTKETVTHRFSRLLFTDRVRLTGLTFTEEEVSTTAITKERIVSAGQDYLVSRKQFEKALDQKKKKKKD